MGRFYREGRKAAHAPIDLVAPFNVLILICIGQPLQLPPQQLLLANNPKEMRAGHSCPRLELAH
jgi:hypothetical protein